MEKKEFLYEGKAKKIWTTDDPSTYVVEYKNSLTAFNAAKKDSIEGKGRLNNLISSALFEHLSKKGIPSHFIRRLDDLHQLVRAVKIVPIEVVVRNITTGSLCKRLGVEEGITLSRPLVELCLKDDALGDPLITEDHALLFGWTTQEQLNKIKEITLKVNSLLSEYFMALGIVLVDFKLEFGTDSEGNILLADEISPDTCRFWDRDTKDRLDKDRFRKDLGNVLDAYEEIWRRISKTL
ncbi:MAG: phosphoribosylaminoimidazolesuccinocarboxamide synthase [Synergistaceae bacterium]|nr:phosphoribosylaminoimidazolesuccinocarboxamide synthase [Synergistaceae bacterium]